MESDVRLICEILSVSDSESGLDALDVREMFRGRGDAVEFHFYHSNL